MLKTLLRTSGLAALTLTGLLASAQAQTPGASDEPIIVTAVRNQVRTTLDTPVPVDVLSGEDVRETGAVASELGQALATLAPAFNFPRQSNSGSSDHVRAGQLRGLSPDQTLVLVNGKRRHPSSIVNSETKIGRGTAAVDFNTIPLGAVKRVEILRDGAGAQYGSDAIAGVVNVILDDAPEGGSIAWSYGLHVTDYDPIDAEIEDGETFTVDADYGVRLGADGFLRAGAGFVDRERTNRAGIDQGPPSFIIDQTPDNIATFGRRNYAEGDPDVVGWNVWFNSEVGFGAARLYGFGTYGDRETRGGAAFFRYPDGPSNVTAIYPEGFRPETTGDDEDLSLTGGARFDVSGWDLDTSLTYGRNEFVYGVENSLNASLGADSPTTFRSGAYIFDQLTALAGVSRAFDLAALSGPLLVGAGVEYRHDTYETEAGEEASYIGGPFDAAIGAQGAPGLTPDDVVDIQRDVWAAYVDVSADVTSRLFVNAAGRYEDYEDFGDELTGKLSAIYRITDAFAVRGAISNSFRAPGLAQVGYSDTTLNFGDNRELVRTRTLRVDDPTAIALGAEDLEPETSVNYSIGATAQPFAGLTVTIDAFQVRVNDRITLSERFFGDAFETFVQGLPGGADIESARFFTNAVDTETQGVDLVASYRTRLAGGDVSLTGAYSYAQTEIEGFAPTPDELLAIDPTFRLVGVEEINTIEEAAPQSKAVVTLEYERGRFGGLVRASHFGSTVRVFNFGGGFEPRQRYGAETQFDVEGRVRLSEIATLAIGSTNVLDEYPDESNSDIFYFGNLPYDILSPVGVNGRFVYARMAVDF